MLPVDTDWGRGDTLHFTTEFTAVPLVGRVALLSLIMSFQNGTNFNFENAYQYKKNDMCCDTSCVQKTKLLHGVMVNIAKPRRSTCKYRYMIPLL